MKEKRHEELRSRLPRMMIPLYIGIVTALQAGYVLTTDGFGLAPHLPIVLAIVASVLILRHGLSAHQWMFRSRRGATVHLAIVGALLLTAALVSLLPQTAHIEGALRIAAYAGLIVPVVFLALFDRLVFRVAHRGPRN